MKWRRCSSTARGSGSRASSAILFETVARKISETTGGRMAIGVPYPIL